METRMADWKFELMANIGLPVRNIFLPPGRLLEEVAVVPGDTVLDFGCGPGAFTFPLADRAGRTGRVYALDIHPLALEKVARKAREGGYANIRTILSDCATALPDAHLDLVVFFDVFHLLGNREEVLRELHRVLKPHGRLCFSDHHMRDAEAVEAVTNGGLFRLLRKGGKTFLFGKAQR